MGKGKEIPPVGTAEIAEFSTEMRSDLTAEGFLEKVIDFFSLKLGASAVSVQVFSPFWKESGLPTLTVSPGHLREAALSHCSSGSGEKALKSGESILEEESVPPEFLPSLQDPYMVGYLPLLTKGQPAGLVTAWMPELILDQPLMSILRDSIAAGLSQLAHTFREEGFIREEFKRALEFWLLQETNNALRGTMKLDKVLRMILTGVTIGHGLKFNRAALFLLNDRGDTLKGMIGVGPDSPEAADEIWKSLDRNQGQRLSEMIVSYAEVHPEQSNLDRTIKHIRIPVVPGGVIAGVVLDRTSVNVTDPRKEPFLERELAEKMEINLFAAVPIIAKDKVLGVIVVDNPYNRKEITDEDLWLLTMYANQAGLAISNAKVYSALARANEDLRSAQDKLAQSERLAALGEIAANLAHEIRNPLVTIGGFARRLSSKFSDLDPNRKYAQIIAAEVRRLENFLEEVLLFGQDMEPRPNPTDLNRSIEETLELFEEDFKESGISINTGLHPHLPVLEADPQRLRQVFFNIFSNAAEAMENGGELFVGTDFEAGPSPAVRITVSDTGGGVSSEVLANIFNPFFTTKTRGHGLGLSLVHRIISSHHGRISVENRADEGLVFTITLPLSPPAKAAARGVSPAISGKE